ncbi:hypothetical protein MgSA37_01992 [Mucilaginibacter gotjawali]|uniref:Uncharacterized protein n=1 Tax=Mucilaginibacter gotjawali TaxID=1550579 RepID=A0A0X8X1A8_9SPHI|nr:hypothetical protein MgSA37_01992 [Mucilaginibacter gotjawali]
MRLFYFYQKGFYQIDFSPAIDNDLIRMALSDKIDTLFKGFSVKKIQVITVAPPSAKISTEALSTTRVSLTDLFATKRGALKIPAKSLLKSWTPAFVLSIKY